MKRFEITLRFDAPDYPAAIKRVAKVLAENHDFVGSGIQGAEPLTFEPGGENIKVQSSVIWELEHIGLLGVTEEQVANALKRAINTPMLVVGSELKLGGRQPLRNNAERVSSRS